MKIVVIGGGGLIGKKLIPLLCERGHAAVSASRSSGVNIVTGDGLTKALDGAEAVVDVSNSPSFVDAAVMEFFAASTRNILAAETAVGVGHHIALLVLRANRLSESGYMRAKVAQEKLIQDGKVPYTILRAAQFFEFINAIAGPGTDGGAVRVPDAPMQPQSADDVAAVLADVAIAPPANAILELAGPEVLPIASFVRQVLVARGDNRTVVADPNVRYFGAALDSRGLTPDGINPRIGSTRFGEWLNRATWQS
jgi:uncharacterized protein YbjT (DUF2867 family)